jgi:hypothetical protein
MSTTPADDAPGTAPSKPPRPPSKLGQALKDLTNWINHLATPDSRRFARLAWTFGIGIPVAVAPLLGTKLVPGFRPLVTVLSRDLRWQVIPFSILIVSLVALTVEFYAAYARKRSMRLTLPWVFPVSLVIFVLALWRLFTLQALDIVHTPTDGGKSFEPVVIAPTRVSGSGCDCVGLGDIDCIQKVSFKPAALDACWGGPERKRIQYRLMEAYLLVIGLFVALVGVVALQRRGGANQPPRRARKRKVPATETGSEAPKP